MACFEKETRGIIVKAEPVYRPDQSTPEDDHYVWAYHIRIDNGSRQTIQLLRRYWRIADSNGIVQEVSGEGVVGEQPRLAPGESYEYTSGAPLHTPSGMMMGRYAMINDEGEEFEIEIPAFSLDGPEGLQRPH